MGDIYTNPPQSRNEAILRATIDGTEYTAPPQSRIEDLLLELKEAIEQGGAGEGDMKKSVYDADNAVATAGGIAAYVDDEITDLHLGTASTKNAISVVTDSSDLVESGAVKEEIDRIDTQLEALNTHRIYGFHIRANESDPDNMVTYLADAVDATPAHMDYARNVFDYGTWEHAFFMPKPCMLKSDGTVAYYLKEDDYTKKADDTASDIANTAFDGNAMMEWGQGSKIWLKIVPDEHGEGASVFIANYQADEDFHDYSFHNSQGVSMDHFYTAIYNGSVINGKMRSLSGQQVGNKRNCADEITAAQANNPSGQLMWNTELYSDITLINMLLILMTKSVDTQTAYGQGIHTGGSEAINNAFRTGVHNAKGLFYGTNSGSVTSSDFSNAVKIFGMENWWGFQWRRYQGHVMVNGSQKVKNTYGMEDGSTSNSYTVGGVPTGDGYKTMGATAFSGTSGNYIHYEYFTADGMVPCGALDADSAHYYCDACWYNNGITSVPRRGGYSVNGVRGGAFCVYLDSDAAYSNWNIGAALSCKPLAQG